MIMHDQGWLIIRLPRGFDAAAAVAVDDIYHDLAPVWPVNEITTTGSL